MVARIDQKRNACIYLSSSQALANKPLEFRCGTDNLQAFSPGPLNPSLKKNLQIWLQNSRVNHATIINPQFRTIDELSLI